MTIPKRIRHKGVCDHPQTPYARRRCRAHKIREAAERAAAEQAAAEQRARRLAELRMTEDDVISWYTEAADRVAMLDGDGYDRHADYWHRELAAARQAMADLGLTPVRRRRRFGRRAA